MKKEVCVPYPMNMIDQNKPLYQSLLSYKPHHQKIKYLKNVFVTFSGFCLNNKGLVKECHHNYPLQQNYYKNEAAQFYFDAVDHPENLIALDDENIYLTIHHPWFNYYHWICESIFRLWLVRGKLDTLILLLPEPYKYADFITGSLEPFNIKNIFYIPKEKSLLVKNLCLPQIKPECDSYNSKHVKEIRDFYRTYVSTVRNIAVKKISKLYISRELAGRRKIINEHEILTIVKKHDFEIFYPEKFTFLEQVAIFSRVKYLVGTHGSGLTNMLFMDDNTSLLELHQKKTNELDHPSPLFWYLAEALNINYYHQICQTHGREDYFEGDYYIDPDLFEVNLRLMVKDSQN